MATTIFFSWQADTPTREGRNLIERALEKAIGGLGDSAELEEAIRELEIDRDTKGVSGSPPIVDTIFKKIDKCAVFVPDLTFVGARIDGRRTPNPNVLIEYGWALKSIGHGRIVPVMNIAHGAPTPENMPFDLRHLRNPITYNCPDDASDDERKAVRAALAREFQSSLRAVIAGEDYRQSLPKPPVPPAFPAVEPQNGAGKFRPHGQALGICHSQLPGRGGYEIYLTEAPAIWLRVMPAHDPGRTWLISDLERAAIRSGTVLMPLTGDSWPGFNYVRGGDGFGVYALLGKQENSTASIVYIFETGEVWSIDTYMLAAATGMIPFLEQRFTSALDQYSNFLSKLGVTGPLKWTAGMEGLKGRGIAFPPPPGHAPRLPGPYGQCVVDAIVEDGSHLAGADTKDSLRPFFTKIFDKCGIERPRYFDGPSGP